MACVVVSVWGPMKSKVPPLFPVGSGGNSSSFLTMIRDSLEKGLANIQQVVGECESDTGNRFVESRGVQIRLLQPAMVE